ncbi:HAMP domain-containing sensor histidine kinase [Kiritimatiellota bacterium B12222]|nr:HAMP domain-containing sensor histidine kinase [Kiritimatiellota bacterium B12222]
MVNLPRLIEKFWTAFPERFLPPDLKDAETLRHAHLIMGITLVGGFFSICFALYYLMIGHLVGAITIFSSCFVFMVFPFIYLKKGRPDQAALLFIFTMMTMFCWLSLVEGGVKGHAVAWLAVMPFFNQLLILDRRRALVLSGLVVVLVMYLSSLGIWNLELPVLYPKEKHGWVTLIGYTGLAVFMYALGFIAEHFRREVVSQRDGAEGKLKEAVAELTRLNLEKNEFLRIVAHDLNNPLTVINGYAEIISSYEKVSDAEIKDYVHEISVSSKRMREIIRNVLDVNAIESGKYPLKMNKISLKPIFKSCLHTYETAMTRKSQILHAELEDVEAVTDAGALSQILDNLVSNAVKYGPIGAHLRINLFEQEGNYCFDVFNEGRGFSPEDHALLFSPFAKLSTRPTGGESSVGLGLSITLKIVEGMGGQITCESALGQGALFRVTIPKGI